MDEHENTKEEIGEEKKSESEELSFSERLKITPIAKPCICGRSKKYPICDGSHNRA